MSLNKQQPKDLSRMVFSLCICKTWGHDKHVFKDDSGVLLFVLLLLFGALKFPLSQTLSFCFLCSSKVSILPLIQSFNLLPCFCLLKDTLPDFVKVPTTDRCSCSQPENKSAREPYVHKADWKSFIRHTTEGIPSGWKRLYCSMVTKNPKFPLLTLSVTLPHSMKNSLKCWILHI